MSKPSLEDYIEVPERIQRFYTQYPDGSLQGSWEIVEVGGDTLIVYTARAFRSSQDPTPGIGTASEPYPGKTPYTKGSELMNAETSAWGRAIVSLGFLAKDEKVVSKEEVKGAQARQSSPNLALNREQFEKHREELLKKDLADKLAALPGTVELATKTQLTKLTKAKELLGPTRFDAYIAAQGVNTPDELTKEAAESVLTWARDQAKRKAA